MANNKTIMEELKDRIPEELNAEFAERVAALDTDFANISTLATAANKAIEDNDLTAHAAALARLQEAVKAFNTAIVEVDYELLYCTEQPLVECIKAGTLDILSVKAEKEDGVVKGYNVGRSETYVDLCLFEDTAAARGYARVTMDGQWRYKIEALDYLLSKYAAEEIEAGNAGDLATTYKISVGGKEHAALLAAKKNPISIGSLTETLQEIVDMILFVDDGKGKNSILIKKQDVRALIQWHTMHGSKIRTTRTATFNLMVRYIMEIMNGKLNGKGYTLEFDAEKSKK